MPSRTCHCSSAARLQLESQRGSAGPASAGTLKAGPRAGEGRGALLRGLRLLSTAQLATLSGFSEHRGETEAKGLFQGTGGAERQGPKEGTLSPR